MHEDFYFSIYHHVVYIKLGNAGDKLMKDTFYSDMLYVISNNSKFKHCLTGVYEYPIIQYREDVANIVTLR